MLLSLSLRGQGPPICTCLPVDQGGGGLLDPSAASTDLQCALTEALGTDVREIAERLLRAGDDEEGGPSALELACAGGLEAAAVIRGLLAAPSSVGREALRRALVRVCEHPGGDDGATAQRLLRARVRSSS